MKHHLQVHRHSAPWQQHPLMQQESSVIIIVHSNVKGMEKSQERRLESTKCEVSQVGQSGASCVSQNVKVNKQTNKAHSQT